MWKALERKAKDVFGKHGTTAKALASNPVMSGIEMLKMTVSNLAKSDGLPTKNSSTAEKTPPSQKEKY